MLRLTGIGDETIQFELIQFDVLHEKHSGFYLQFITSIWLHIDTLLRKIVGNIFVLKTLELLP